MSHKSSLTVAHYKGPTLARLPPGWQQKARLVQHIAQLCKHILYVVSLKSPAIPYKVSRTSV